MDGLTYSRDSNVGKNKCIIVIALGLSKNQPGETLRIVLL